MICIVLLSRLDVRLFLLPEIGTSTFRKCSHSADVDCMCVCCVVSVCCTCGVVQDGMTPLHIAAKSGNAELVRYLVLSGADIDEYNQVRYHYTLHQITRTLSFDRSWSEPPVLC